MLENTLRAVADWRITFASHAFASDRNHLARLDIAEIGRANQIEGARFRGEYITNTASRQFQAPEGERTETVRVARHQNVILRQKDQRERSFELQKSLAQCA